MFYYLISELFGIGVDDPTSAFQWLWAVHPPFSGYGQWTAIYVPSIGCCFGMLRYVVCLFLAYVVG